MIRLNFRCGSGRRHPQVGVRPPIPPAYPRYGRPDSKAQLMHYKEFIPRYLGFDIGPIARHSIQLATSFPVRAATELVSALAFLKCV